MTVDSKELRRIASEVKNEASVYNKHIEEIYSKLKGNLHEYWSGDDYDAFLKNMDSKKSSADAITSSLKKLADYLEQRAKDADLI